MLSSVPLFPFIVHLSSKFLKVLRSYIDAPRPFGVILDDWDLITCATVEIQIMEMEKNEPMLIVFATIQPSVTPRHSET